MTEEPLNAAGVPLSWGRGTPSHTEARVMICAALAAGEGEIGICRWVGKAREIHGDIVKPEELWIEAIGCWCRTDGTRASFDRARGGVEFNEGDAALIRAACDAWKEANR